MGKKLAIKGHKTRSNEVIELLKMMGGKDAHLWLGIDSDRIYYISDGYVCWDYIGPEEIDKYEIFDLEEFWDKYPFKVGDKVVYTKFGDNCDDYPVTIESMKWTGTTIEYTFDDCVTCLAKDLKMWNEEHDMEEEMSLDKAGQITHFEYEGLAYTLPDGYIFKDENGNEILTSKIILEKKKNEYPKTYEECCKLLSLGEDGRLYTKGHKASLIQNLQILLICRNAYWKIAGEEMGLGKPWEPKFGKYIHYSINFYLYKDSFLLHKGEYHSSDNRILVFPTEEMRDAFYENFKNEIEQCKELL